jgi:hypothetical protein
MAAVPWAEIKEDETRWFPRGCWDPTTDFMDPSKFRDQEARSIYQHLHNRQRENQIPIAFIKALDRDYCAKFSSSKSRRKSTTKKPYVEVGSSDDESDEAEGTSREQTPVATGSKRKRDADATEGENAEGLQSPLKKQKSDPHCANAKGKGKEREKMPQSKDDSLGGQVDGGNAKQSKVKQKHAADPKPTTCQAKAAGNVKSLKAQPQPPTTNPNAVAGPSKKALP